MAGIITPAALVARTASVPLRRIVATGYAPQVLLAESEAERLAGRGSEPGRLAELALEDDQVFGVLLGATPQLLDADWLCAYLDGATDERLADVFGNLLSPNLLPDEAIEALAARLRESGTRLREDVRPAVLQRAPGPNTVSEAGFGALEALAEIFARAGEPQADNPLRQRVIDTALSLPGDHDRRLLSHASADEWTYLTPQHLRASEGGRRFAALAFDDPERIAFASTAELIEWAFELADDDATRIDRFYALLDEHVARDLGTATDAMVRAGVWDLWHGATARTSEGERKRAAWEWMQCAAWSDMVPPRETWRRVLEDLSPLEVQDIDRLIPESADLDLGLPLIKGFEREQVRELADVAAGTGARIHLSQRCSRVPGATQADVWHGVLGGGSETAPDEDWAPWQDSSVLSEVAHWVAGHPRLVDVGRATARFIGKQTRGQTASPLPEEIPETLLEDLALEELFWLLQLLGRERTFEDRHATLADRIPEGGAGASGGFSKLGHTGRVVREPTPPRRQKDHPLTIEARALTGARAGPAVETDKIITWLHNRRRFQPGYTSRSAHDDRPLPALQLLTTLSKTGPIGELALEIIEIASTELQDPKWWVQLLIGLRDAGSNPNDAWSADEDSVSTLHAIKGEADRRRRARAQEGLRQGA